jgi:RimJ/RimL family protein N-acetyltransferase
VIPLSIRPITRADRAAVAFSLEHLGARSRHQRYFTAVPRLGPRELDRLTSLDHWHREALIAFAPVPRRPVGVAEYIRLDEFDVAEVAIAVVDQWQRQGVGQALLEALRARALAAGVRRFEATMLRDNKGARALARHLGTCTTRSAVHSLLVVIVDL